MRAPTFHCVVERVITARKSAPKCLPMKQKGLSFLLDPVLPERPLRSREGDFAQRRVMREIGLRCRLIFLAVNITRTRSCWTDGREKRSKLADSVGSAQNPLARRTALQRGFLSPDPAHSMIPLTRAVIAPFREAPVNQQYAVDVSSTCDEILLEYKRSLGKARRPPAPHREDC